MVKMVVHFSHLSNCTANMLDSDSWKKYITQSDRSGFGSRPDGRCAQRCGADRGRAVVQAVCVIVRLQRLCVNLLFFKYNNDPFSSNVAAHP